MHTSACGWWGTHSVCMVASARVVRGSGECEWPVWSRKSPAWCVHMACASAAHGMHECRTWHA